MASRFELQLALKQAFDKIMPKPVGKMKRDEMARTLKVFEAAADVAEKTPLVPVSKAVRAIPVAKETVDEMDVKVPRAPLKRITDTHSKEERASARAAAGVVPHASSSIIVKKQPTPRTRQVMVIKEEETVPKPASVVPVESDDDTDPKAARIVRAHKPRSAAAAPASEPPKKVHRCNCLFCDKKGTTI